MEALYHVPLSAWAIYGLSTESPLVPLHLLVYAVQTGITTGTCISEALTWTGLTGAERQALMGLYVPYLGVCKFFVLKLPKICVSGADVEI
jgi:hypothetical protein